MESTGPSDPSLRWDFSTRPAVQVRRFTPDERLAAGFLGMLWHPTDVMGILDRAQGLLTSNFNALLSRFEEPGRDLAWLLREMGEQIRGAERELIRTMGERKRSESRFADLDAQVAQWEKRAELAVKSGDDALAREALAQRQRCAAERDSLAVSRAEQHRIATAMKAEIERMRRTHRDYSSRQGTIAAQFSQARAGGGATGLGARPGQDSFDEFDRVAGGIEHSEAEVAAHAEIEQMLTQSVAGGLSRIETEDAFRELEQASPARDHDADGENVAEGAATAKPRIRIEP